MFVCQIGSTEAQFERYFLGAFAGYIKAVTMAKLRQDSIPVISYKAMTDSPKLDRPPKRVEDLTATGRECWMRCRHEGERRFCDNGTEEVDGSSPVVFDKGHCL